MLTGKQKARLLLSLLGNQSTDILKRLSKESSDFLTGNIEEAPNLEGDELNDFITEVTDLVTQKKETSISEELEQEEQEEQE